MMYGAMAEDYDFFREHLYKVAQIAPCTIVDGGQSLFSRDAVSAVGALSAQGVYAIGGPNWHRDIVKVRNTLGLVGLQGFLAAGYSTVRKDVSLKSYDHYAQNYFSKRFQKYSDTYWLPDGQQETEEYDLSVITETPIGMFMAGQDKACSPAQNEITRAEIGAAVEVYKTYADETHQSMLINMAKKEVADDVIDFLKPEKSGWFRNQ